MAERETRPRPGDNPRLTEAQAHEQVTDRRKQGMKLPETYVAVPPFGVEVLQVFASTRPFPSIPTETEVVQGETYKVVRVNSDKELGTVVAKLRGIRIDAPEGEAEPLVAEARVTLTTMK